MRLIGEYHDSGYLALADAVMTFFDRRPDLQRPGVAFGEVSGAGGGVGGDAGGDDALPGKVSTDISLVWLDRSDRFAHHGALLDADLTADAFVKMALGDTGPRDAVYE